MGTLCICIAIIWAFKNGARFYITYFWKVYENQIHAFEKEMREAEAQALAVSQSNDDYLGEGNDGADDISPGAGDAYAGIESDNGICSDPEDFIPWCESTPKTLTGSSDPDSAVPWC